MADTRIDELRRRLEKDPGSRLFAQLAEELRKNGELAEAIRVARSGLAVHSAYPSARLTLGRALLDSGDATGARAELESAVRDAPDNIQASRYLAQAREQLGDLRGAVEQYRRTLLMTPEDRQLQGALAVVEGRLGGPGGTAAPLPGTTPPVTRLSPPPLPARAPDALGTPSEPSPLRAAAPLVFAPSRPAAAPAPEPGDDGSSEGGPLPPTLRIHASQTSAPPVLPPLPSAVPPPAPPPPPPPAVGVRATAGPETTLVPDAGGLGTLPVRRVEAAIAESAAQDSVAEQAAAEGPSGATAPFSSSTLAELYFQQGLVDRAVDVYHQLLEQEPHNEKAQKRLAELRLGAPAADERAARRRVIERTIAGLEGLLGAVRRR